MTPQYMNLIDGNMVGATAWLDVLNPANEEVIGQVPDCGEQELDAAVAAARAAFFPHGRKRRSRNGAPCWCGFPM